MSGGETLGHWTSPQKDSPRGEVKLLVGSGAKQDCLSTDVRTLISSSPHFANVLSARDYESNRPEWIVLPDDDPMVILNIVKYISVGTIRPGVSMKEGIATLCTATKYQMPAVAKEYRHYLMNNLKGVADAVETLESAATLMDPELQNICIRYLTQRFPLLVTTHIDSFVKLSRDSIITILKSDESYVKAEEDVLEACLKWAKAECVKRQRSPQNYLEVRAALGEIIGLIRFPTLDPQTFRVKYAAMGLLSSQDLEILNHYWTLRERDPVAAEGMDLLYSKERRTGSLYIATLYKRKPCDKVWNSPKNQFISIKLWSDWSIRLQSVLLYGKPAEGRSTAVVVRLTEKIVDRYRTVVSNQESIIRITTYPGNSSRIEFQPCLTLKAGRKHILELGFFAAGMVDDSLGSTLANQWKTLEARVPPNVGDGTIKIMAKKINGADCLFHSLEYTFAKTMDSNIGAEPHGIKSSAKPPESGCCVA